MPCSPDDEAWIERKAAEYADQSGYVDPMAIELAEAEFERLRARPRAPVIPIDHAATTAVTRGSTT